MEHVWSVICTVSITDNERNNISLIETLERIVFGTVEDADVPAIPVGLEVISLWWREEEHSQEERLSRLQFISPSGNLLLEHETPVDLTKFRRIRSKSLFQGLPFENSGIYRFVIQFLDGENWRTVASLPLEIIRNPNGQ
jgi:hypothetical protein